ncbi:MAG: ORF6N domain-containing protein [Paludibacteraceae bacterium]|nr:ORF6N domain-containing protein [Paludibacteraceae bacterium]
MTKESKLPSSKEELLPLQTPLEDIENLILNIRGKQVMLDRDLARLYGVETKRLNEAVKRNIERFPERFMFQLTDYEFVELVANCDRFSSLKHSTSFPFAFTEQGVSMLSAVLKSNIAINTSIMIMDAFVTMRHSLNKNYQLHNRIELLEQNQLANNKLLQKHTKQFEVIFDKIFKHDTPTEGVFHNGQIFDAYKFATDLIKSAKKSLVLIDNYVDESVLMMLSKRSVGVSAQIYTSHFGAALQLDLQRHNTQYPPIEMVHHTTAHDRFLIIDDAEVYHIGASLKDLGKKLFAFSKLNIPPSAIL